MHYLRIINNICAILFMQETMPVTIQQQGRRQLIMELLANHSIHNQAELVQCREIWESFWEGKIVWVV